LEHGTITVHGAIVPGPSGPVAKDQNKNRSSTRKVPIMIPRLSEALKACEKEEGLVVPQAPCTLLGDVKRACRIAGITEVTAHGLRHSFASLCYRQGVNERQTMSWGGWSDYHTMHKIYIRLAAVAETEAKNLVSSFFSD
jgi:integrase